MNDGGFKMNENHFYCLQLMYLPGINNCCTDNVIHLIKKCEILFPLDIKSEQQKLK